MQPIKVLFTGLAIVFSHLVGVSGDLLSCTQPELRAKCITIAKGELQVRENIAANDALRIREYKKAIGSKFNYPVAWCGIFVSWVYNQVGLQKSLPYGPEWVPSWSANKKQVIYTRGNADNQQPCPGDAVTFFYPRQGREGHIGLIKEWPSQGKYFYTIEGNTNSAGSREGDGVYVKMRLKTDAYKIIRIIA